MISKSNYYLYYIILLLFVFLFFSVIGKFLEEIEERTSSSEYSSLLPYTKSKPYLSIISPVKSTSINNDEYFI